MFATVLPSFSRGFRRVAAGVAASLALGRLSAHAAPTPFPADFHSSQVVNADATDQRPRRRPRARGRADPRLGETGTCGPDDPDSEGPHRRRADLRAWACPRTRRGYDKVDAGRPTSASSSTSSASTRRHLGHDIGVMVAYAYAGALSGQDNRWSDRFAIPASRRGTDRAPAALWHFTSAARSDAWSPAASASTSTASGTSSPATRRRSTKRPAATTRDLRQPARCIPRRPNSSRSTRRTRPTNLKAMETKLAMPVLAIGAEKASAPTCGRHAQRATNVQEVVVPNAGHWLMEKRPRRRSPHAGLPRSALSPAALLRFRPRPLLGAVRGTQPTGAMPAADLRRFCRPDCPSREPQN